VIIQLIKRNNCFYGLEGFVETLAFKWGLKIFVIIAFVFLIGRYGSVFIFIRFNYEIDFTKNRRIIL